MLSVLGSARVQSLWANYAARYLPWAGFKPLAADEIEAFYVPGWVVDAEFSVTVGSGRGIVRWFAGALCCRKLSTPTGEQQIRLAKFVSRSNYPIQVSICRNEFTGTFRVCVCDAHLGRRGSTILSLTRRFGRLLVRTYLSDVLQGSDNLMEQTAANDRDPLDKRASISTRL